MISLKILILILKFQSTLFINLLLILLQQFKPKTQNLTKIIKNKFLDLICYGILQ